MPLAAFDPLEDLEEFVEAAFARVGLGKILRNSIARARRAVVLGPFVGGGVSIPFDGDPGAAITGGLSFTKLAVPIFPSNLIREAAKRVAARLPRDRQPTRQEIDAVIEEVVAEMVAELRSRGFVPRRFEKPGLAARLEAIYYSEGDAFDIRLAGAIGISRVFLGTGIAINVDDGAAFVIPVELWVPMTLSGSKRSPLLDFFGRVDFAVSKRDERSDTAVIGLRLHLDII